MSDFTISKLTRSDDWETPRDLYAKLDAEFHFDDDPCPLNGQGLPLLDGLARDWGKSVFINPPYSNPAPWLVRANTEALKGKTIVALLRGDTSANWFHDFVLPFAELRFIRHRLNFNGAGRAAFPSIIAIWRGK